MKRNRVMLAGSILPNRGPVSPPHATRTHSGSAPAHSRSLPHDSVLMLALASSYPLSHVYVALLGYSAALVVVEDACATAGTALHGKPRHTPALAPPQPTRS